ncbi:MAG: NAD-dependent epimerase/dehydratase family protein [Deltaproteobacteria bacterium]|nr:NAD-dependent epimerase/dehydratase family protein [Deltaproteobacteria bacterium]
MRVLVTGATGFIGYHTAKRLRAEGHSVRALVRSPEKAARVLGPLGIERDALVVGDMGDGGAVDAALEGCDSVVHAAASVSVTDGRTDLSPNLRGTETVIGRACERGLYSIFISSVTAIFDPKLPVTEDSALVPNKTLYGRSKAQCDDWVRTRQAAGAPVSILYPAGVVGPDDPGFSESVKAYRMFLRGTLKSEGGNLIVDVRDLALLLTRMLEAKIPGRVVAAGHFLDWDELTEALEQVTGTRVPRIRAPGWLLRGGARTLDVIGKLTGRPMPITGDAIEIATRFSRMNDSPRVAELGISWRPPRETLTDMYRWYLEVGKLPATAVPALANSR